MLTSTTQADQTSVELGELRTLATHQQAEIARQQLVLHEQQSSIDELVHMHRGLTTTHAKFRKRLVVGASCVLVVALASIVRVGFGIANACSNTSTSSQCITGLCTAVQGSAYSDTSCDPGSGTGVYGTSGTGNGVYGTAGGGYGVQGYDSSSGVGVYGHATGSNDPWGVYGVVDATASGGIGVVGSGGPSGTGGY